MTLSNFDDVGQFHRKFGLDHVGEFSVANTGPRPMDHDLMDFRIRFMNEEFEEFLLGYEEMDHAQMADALIDLVYVVMGTAHLMGYPWHDLWDAVQKANMSKERAENADQSKRGSALDVIKPEGWQPPPIREILERHGWKFE